MIGSSRIEQQYFREVGALPDIRVQKYGSDSLGKLRTPRLTGEKHFNLQLAQSLGQHSGLG